MDSLADIVARWIDSVALNGALSVAAVDACRKAIENDEKVISKRLTDMHADYMTQAETIATLRAEVERLKKELAANVIATNAEMKADAERYRWLRNANADDLMVCSGFDCETVGSSRVVGTYEQGLTGLVLDAAIDAARIQKARKAK